MKVALDLSNDADPGARVRAALESDVSELSVASAMGASPIAALASESRMHLRRLSLLEQLGDMEPRCRHEPDSLWQALPNLEWLRLRSERPLFHTISHARLEVLELEVAPLCEEGQWLLPALRALDWDPHIESECDIDALDLLWRQELPALRELALRGYLVTFEPTLEREEVRRFIAGLERLWLPFDSIIPSGGELELTTHLIDNAAHLEHLAELVVFGAQFERESAADLKATAQSRLPNLKFAEQRLAASVIR